MIIRFVQMRAADTNGANLKLAYERLVIPALRATAGCRSASLLQKNGDPQVCISMTTWRSIDDAERYERSGEFKKLLDGLQPYFAEADDWKLGLRPDLTVSFEPVVNEPIVQRFEVAAEGASSTPSAFIPDYLRVVSHRIRPGAAGIFRKIYEDQVLPLLRVQEGYRRAYLVEDPTDINKLLSVTAWSSKRDADRYERSGLFLTLLERLAPTLTDLAHWKLSGQTADHARIATSDDVAVDGYTLLIGEEFIA
ncbi:MAG: antibiotic biosynthesis monooxygenase [Bacteroidetes bacterium]|jgi:quinol monooxygenase YgiN|nr:antibiotic biosynthesis monooxygenase [Bacteroidota bacterium]